MGRRLKAFGAGVVALFATYAVLHILDNSIREASISPDPNRGPDRLVLTPVEEKEFYEIYSLLLKWQMAFVAEMHPGKSITSITWFIKRETQPLEDLARDKSDMEICLRGLSQDKRAIYQPLIDDYINKNKKILILERKFDLPRYTLTEQTHALLPISDAVVLDVSAVGFNRDRTRALVSLQYWCGGICGEAGYYFLVKKDGRWQADPNVSLIYCTWRY